MSLDQADFEEIFEQMAGLPVTIRLLDWPLHEFLPSIEEADDPRLRERVRALLPRSTAMRIRSPTPSSSIVSNGSRSRMPCSR